jgi:hypothetical protein
MSTNFELQFQETTVPNRVDLCGTSPYNVSTGNTGPIPMLIRR